MALPADSFFSPELGEQLLAERLRRGMSQADAAAEVGTTQQTWGRWEKGKLPQVRWRKKLDDFLNPPASVSTLHSVPIGPAPEQELSTEQAKTLEAVRTRFASGAALSPGEVATVRSMFRAVGLDWDDDA